MGSGGIGLEEVLRHPCLRIDHGDVVGEDVVQVVGDAHALRDHTTLRLGLLAALSCHGTLIGGGQLGSPLSDELSDRR